MIPDIDSPDAAVFHSDLKGLDHGTGRLVNDFIGPVLPLFGYLTRYLIYRPSLGLYDHVLLRGYDFGHGHRAFSHSILGVATITGLTGFYLLWPVLQLGIGPGYLAVFLASYGSGMFLHLFQDSATRSGIAWNSPFSDFMVRGELVTGRSMRRPRLMLYVLAAISLSSLYFSLHATHIPKFTVISGSASLTAGAWVLFMVLGAEAGFS